MKILAIDPGTNESGWCMFYDNNILGSGVMSNNDMRKFIQQSEIDVLAIEMIASYGMPVGKQTFETCLWIGRFVELSLGKAELVYRKDVKIHLCNSLRAKDQHIRQALIDRFGAIGNKKNPGKLYGVKSHAWSALAVAVTYSDCRKNGNIQHKG